MSNGKGKDVLQNEGPCRSDAISFKIQCVRLCFCHGFISSLVSLLGRREAGKNSFEASFPLASCPNQHSAAWRPSPVGIQALTSTQELLPYLSGCRCEEGKAGTEGKSSESQTKWSLFGVTPCIRAGEKMKGSVYASVAFSLLVPGISLPPKEQRQGEAVTSYSCLFMFILKRCERSCLCCLRQRKWVSGEQLILLGYFWARWNHKMNLCPPHCLKGRYLFILHFNAPLTIYGGSLNEFLIENW